MRVTGEGLRGACRAVINLFVWRVPPQDPWFAGAVLKTMFVWRVPPQDPRFAGAVLKTLFMWRVPPQDPRFAGAVLKTLFVPVLPPRFCCTLALCSTGSVGSLLTQSTSCFVSQAGPSVTHTNHGGQQVSLLRLRQ